MILTENELFAQFVLLSGSKIYFTDKVLLWVTQRLVTLGIFSPWCSVWQWLYRSTTWLPRHSIKGDTNYYIPNLMAEKRSGGSGGVIKRVLHAHCQIGGNSRVAVAGPGLGLLLLLTPSIVVMTRTGRGRRNVIIIRVPPPPRDTRQQQQRGTRHW